MISQSLFSFHLCWNYFSFVRLRCHHASVSSRIIANGFSRFSFDSENDTNQTKPPSEHWNKILSVFRMNFIQKEMDSIVRYLSFWDSYNIVVGRILKQSISAFRIIYGLWASIAQIARYDQIERTPILSPTEFLFVLTLHRRCDSCQRQRSKHKNKVQFFFWFFLRDAFPPCTVRKKQK